MKAFMKKHHWIAFGLLMLAMTLGGCQTDGTTQSIIRDVCPALTGPIHYSTNQKSAIYAAIKLRPQLARQNGVGLNLHCPNYR